MARIIAQKEAEPVKNKVVFLKFDKWNITFLRFPAYLIFIIFFFVCKFLLVINTLCVFNKLCTKHNVGTIVKCVNVSEQFTWYFVLTFDRFVS